MNHDQEKKIETNSIDNEESQEDPLYLDVTVDQSNQQCYCQRNKEHETIFYDLTGSIWPKKLILINAHPTPYSFLKKCEYYPRKTVKAAIIMSNDTDNAIGHCECMGCRGKIDFNDKFCRHCGSKIERNKLILKEKQ